MTTVVDELVIKLGLDNSSFRDQVTKSQTAVRHVSEEAQKQAKLIESAGQQAANFFTKLRNEALALFALFIGTSSIKQFISQVTSADAATGRMASNLGIAVDELSAWQKAVKLAGGTAEDISGSMEKITQDFEGYKRGQPSQFAGPLASLGIGYRDPKTGQMRPVTEILKDLGDAYSKMSMQQAIGWGAQFGQSPAMVRFLRQGRAGIDAALAEQRKLGVVTEKDSNAAIELTNSFTKLSAAIEDIGRAAVTAISGPLKEFMDFLKDWIVQNKEWLKYQINEKVQEFVTWIKGVDWKGVWTGIEEFAHKVDDVVKALGGWKAVTEALFALWLGNKFFDVIKAIATLTGAIMTNPILMALLALAAGGAAAYETGTEGAIAGKLGFRPSGTPGSIDEFGNVFSWTNPKTGETIDAEEMKKRVQKYREEHPGGDLLHPSSFTTDLSMAPEKRVGLDALSVGESGGRYDAQNPTSTAHGRYQFINSTDAEVSAATGLFGRDPESKDRKGWYLMARTYFRNTGRDLAADLKSGGHDEEIAYALNRVWPSLPGGSQQNTTMAQWKARLEAARRHYADTREADASMLRGARGTALAANNSRTTTNTSTASTHVNGPINIQTAATDADGIARGIASGLRRHLPVVEANYGLA